MAEEKKTLEDLKDITSEIKAKAVAAQETDSETVVVQPKIDAQGRSYATGKRKDAVARVWIKPVKALSRSMAAIKKFTLPVQRCA